MEGNDGDGEAHILYKASRSLNTKLKKYDFDRVKAILDTNELGIDTSVTDTKMAILSLCCSIQI